MQNQQEQKASGVISPKSPIFNRDDAEQTDNSVSKSQLNEHSSGMQFTVAEEILVAEQTAEA